MLANASSLLTLNPVIVTLTLILYGLSLAYVFAYIRRKFRVAGRTLESLKTDWDSAETLHSDLFESAQDRITRFSAEPAAIKPFIANSGPITSDTRSQVALMGRKGLPVSEIARSCGLPEGEVDVLLSMARMQRAEA